MQGRHLSAKIYDVKVPELNFVTSDLALEEHAKMVKMWNP